MTPTSTNYAPRAVQVHAGKMNVSVKHGRVVLTPGENHPYKVVLEHEDDQFTEHPVQSVREGEELIRQSSGAKPKPDRLREWNPLM